MLNIKKIYWQNNLPYLLSILAILNIFFQSLSLITITVSIASIFLIISKLKLLGSYFSVFVVSCVLWMAYTQAASVLDWSLNIHGTLNIIITIGAFLVALSFFACKNISVDNRHDKNKQTLFSSTDLFASVLVILSFSVLLVGAIRGGIHSNSVTVQTIALRSASDSLDDSSHLSMFIDHIRIDRGIVLNTKSDELINNGSNSNYPRGWHIANAAFIKLFVGNGSNNDIATLFTIYVGIKYFWFLILIWVIFVVCFTLVQQIQKKKPDAVQLSVGFVLSATSLFFDLVNNFREGFFSFVPLLLYIVLLLLFWSKYLLSGNKKNQSSILLLISVILVGIAGTWSLLAPALFLSAICLFIISVFKKGYVKPNLTQLIFIILMGIASIVQLYVVIFGNDRNASSFINEVGSISIYNPILIVLISAAMTIIFICTSVKNDITKVFMIHILSILGLCSSLYLYQLATKGAVDYYFYKSFRVLMLLLSMSIIVAVAVWIFNKNAKSISEKIYLGVGVSSLIVLLFLVVGFDQANVKYLLGARMFNHTDSSLIFRSFAESKVHSDADTFLYRAGNPGVNIVGNNLIRSGNRITGCENAYFSAAIITQGKDVTSSPECLYEKNKKIIFIGTKDDIKVISNYIGAYPSRENDNEMIETNY